MIEVTKKYKVEILSHPKEGAQEWLGNTKHIFTEFLEFAVERTEQYRQISSMVLQADLYVDRNGKKSETGTYYWDTHDYSGPVIHKLYGPVKARVTLVEASVDL